MNDIFHTIILTARPAAGKSEVIDFLKKLDPATRRERFHVGEIVEIDDFPYIWEKFEEDQILAEAGRDACGPTTSSTSRTNGPGISS